ncbi:MAG: protein kinase [Deltaproteobacteria bacterium]|nr:protein kinase [Deltaproteobacteria bacterium]
MATGPAGSSSVRGKRFGRYRLLEVIGRGGMAEVYRAVAQGPGGFQRQFVLKRIRAEKAESADFVDMFINEARISAMLEHPNIVQVYDFGEVDGDYFLAMEYLRGRDLLTVMRHLRSTGRDLPIGIAAFAVNEVARGLAYAHGLSQAGKGLDIVHRDVTPSNIMLLKTGGVKLLDFGIARAAMKLRSTTPASGLIKGKFAYLSPEQVRGKPIDGRSDIFSLGVVFWECLVGQRLFYDNNDLQTMRNIVEKDVPPPSLARPGLPPTLDDIVLRALDRDPARRIPSAQALVESLSGYLSGTRFQSDSVARLLEEVFGTDSWNEEPLPEMSITPIPPPPPTPRSLIAQARAGRTTAERAEEDAGYSVVSSVRPLPDLRPKTKLHAAAAAVAGTLILGGAGFALRSKPAPHASTPVAAVAPAAPSPAVPVPAPAAAVPAPAPAPEAPTPVTSPPLPQKPAPLAVAHATKPVNAAKLPVAAKAKLALAPPAPARRAEDVAAAREARLRGLQALDNGQMQRARTALEAALVDLPNDAEVLSGLGEAAFELGDYKGARNYARRAIGLGPRAIKNHLLLGDVCFKMGLLPEALEAYKSAAALSPNDASIRTRLARVEAKL